MLSWFTTKKTVVRNRELGPGGVHLKDYGIPGRINLVEALSDMAEEDDRASDHLDDNDVWIDLDAQKDTIKAALQPKSNVKVKSDVQVTVEATDEMVNELQACIIDDYWTEEGIQRRAVAALNDSVVNWLEGIDESNDTSEDEHSVSSKESFGAKANIYQLPKFETFQKTKFNGPVFDNEKRLTAYNDRILSSAVF
ncbi:uncharacterized protein FFB20_15078 [Fusarium fujikuroi]|uniref:Uncharacterized protein n=2 Tax=Fusarium fujikuroi TaxID=5127 RepID=S0EK96_GIBF5|nr:uncharacterized protein FFUJ_10354 [Fusarium fujikuroi IMI 58289]KLP05519.1 uncharacterized protein Y057_7613 [Fusarium fujikuroi]KLP19282.1 uncharacterized protein LW94_3787 [Fusarium fujikuroi]QGI69742.1 hypothetical protein CEK27_002071 [Fusarium fujikuroi]QGI87087.1 hypothetical protein CEK25_002043 [Fusarium fujikuroi]QGJ00631.1 hypothetical protein CEK26_002075 [Fusarium fujikuroi]